MNNSIKSFNWIVGGKWIDIVATIQDGSSPDNIQEGAEGQCGAK